MINLLLHEHFKVARAARMRQDPEMPRYRDINDGLEHCSCVFLAADHKPGAKTDATGGHAVTIWHNPKTGEVKSLVENNHGDRIWDETSDPIELIQKIKEARKMNYKML